VLRLKDFLKKALYFDLVYNITWLFFNNIYIFQKGYAFKIFFDFWVVWNLVYFFLEGLLAIVIIKFLSTKINKFLYDSIEFICYSVVIYKCFDWFEICFFHSIHDYFFGIPADIIVICYFTLGVLALYYFWKYRIEIGIGLFIPAYIFHKTHLETPFFRFLNISHPSDFLLGILLVIICILVLFVMLFLRKLKIYDFRSRKDKWLELQGEGPYKRYRAKES